MESIANMVGCPTSELSWTKPYGGDEFSPFWYLTLPSEDIAKKIADRSILIRGMFELWGEGSSWEELQAAIEACPAELKDPWIGPEHKFKIVVDTYGCKFTMEQQLENIERLAFIPFKGLVDLREPDIMFWLMVCNCSVNNGIPDTVPYRMYFGRPVGLSDRRVLLRYELKSRAYLGPTSMDHEMAFIMANTAKISKGAAVLDPYVGTGSIIVAAAHYGAYTLGADIDIRVLREGKVGEEGQTLDIFSNFKQYGLQPPAGLLRCDMHRNPFRDNLEEVLDAVVGDPPYGVRAGARKSAPREVVIHDRSTHIPRTEPYTLGEVLRDLLDLSARLLKIGGRLVYFFPATPDTYKEEIPSHPALKLVYNCEQLLTTRYSRRLIVMEKVLRYSRQEADDHHRKMGPPVLAIDQVHDVVYERYKDDKGNVIQTDKPVNKKPFRGKLC